MGKAIYDKEEYSNLDWDANDISKDRKSNIKFKSRKRKELLKMENRRRDLEISTVESMYRPDKEVSERKKKLTTTKIIMYLILINCFMIEVYSMWAMIVMHDLMALNSLIGAVIGESIAFAVYCYKSLNESKEEAKSQLERDKFEASLIDLNNNGIDDRLEDPDLSDIHAKAE